MSGHLMDAAVGSQQAVDEGRDARVRDEFAAIVQ